MGGLSLRAHLTLCRAAMSQIRGSTWILSMIPLAIIYVSSFDGMSVPIRVCASIVLVVAGLVWADMLTAKPTTMRLFGFGARQIRAHTLISTATGLGAFLLLITALWGAWVLWASGPGPFFGPVVLVVLVFTLNALRTTLRELTAGDDKARSASISADEKADASAAQENAHHRVIEMYARGGITSVLVVFAVAVVPAQLVLRAIAGSEDTVVFSVLLVSVIATVTFTRVIQTEKGLRMWLVFGGPRMVWFRAVGARSWMVVLGFAATFGLAGIVEWTLVDPLGWMSPASLLYPTSLANWTVMVAGGAAMGIAAEALTSLMLSVTVTLYGAAQAIASVAVFIAGSAGMAVVLSGLDSSSGVATGQLVTILACVAAGVVGWAALRFATGRADMKPVQPVASYFGVEGASTSDSSDVETKAAEVREKTMSGS